MAIDLTGINNENEFYTHHYLSAILEGDLKDLFSNWSEMEKEDDVKSPYSLLKSLSGLYFKTRESVDKEKSVVSRLKLQRAFSFQLLDALGYGVNPVLATLDDDRFLPVLSGVDKKNGTPELWVLEGVNRSGDDISPLEFNFLECQYRHSSGFNQNHDLSGADSNNPSSGIYPNGEPSVFEASIGSRKTLLESNLEHIISKEIFGLEEPPRWIIIISMTRILLIDRTKWNEKRLIRFDLNEIFGRKEPSTLKAVCALLARESICPADGLSLLDTLDENSHKNAFSVSEDLKYALRQSIEMLGNEAIYYLKTELKEKVYGTAMEDQLRIECLRYMYRLLFLFYIEARPELGYVPMKSDAYRNGYSLETLRDLEITQLTTEESRNGYFIHYSISTLFDLIYNGFDPKEREFEFGNDKPLKYLFEMAPLESHLFDPEKTKLLARVKFRNSTLRDIIELMSLTKKENGRHKRRGRISYAQLGINQLGAVYEALLSYRGFFAEEDLYEVKKKKDKHNELETAYFVKAEDLEKYTEDERVFNQDGTLKKFEKGTFVYRLAGREREKSASYYTPEVLTKCLVKYALKELLKDKTADDILHLTVCEPAMGSAAFLNEAINQLSEKYLTLKQKEINITIPHEAYSFERQKVKMFIADNNVFGVDLNPVAVELAEVSLWLNTIHKGGYVPWFGMQLTCGNSLIGARKQVFDADLLRRSKKTDPLWLDQVPVRVNPGETRPQGSVYHFLLPDKGMVDYKDKVIKQIAANEIQQIIAWKKEFIKPFSKSQIQTLEKLSKSIDMLWESHTKELKILKRRTTDPLHVFGQPELDGTLKKSKTKDKDHILQQELYSENIRHSSVYRRLRLVMDYWCALWFWPIEKADLLPSREEFLFEMSLILEGNLLESHSGESPPVQQLLFPDTRPRQQYLDLVDSMGFVNVDKLCKDSERLGLVRRLGKKYRFMHWELEFADIFEGRGGFDLILGNPPWLKVEWTESGILGDFEPLFILRKYSASKLNTLRAEALERYHLRSGYLSEYEEASGTQNFLNGYQNYPVLKRVQTNLFKCFLPQAWMIGNKSGISGFLHPEGIYDDPKGGGLRKEVYPRLRSHFQFHNEMSLFAEVHHVTKFSINIYENNKNEIKFNHLANLFIPQTVYSCFEHSGYGSVPGIKDDNNKWNINGHSKRIIPVDKNTLELFTRLYDVEGTSGNQARLPALHSQVLIEVLRKFADCPQKLGDLKGEYFSTEMWHETNAQKDGTIRRETCFPEKPENLILSGPLFFVGNPCYKTPREKCTLNSHYDILDLTEIPDDYLPRTNYVPDCDYEEYLRRTPKVPWDDKKSVTEYYRFVNREMLSQSGERTLIPVIIPKGIGHINTCLSSIFRNNEDLLNYFSMSISIPVDFRVKSTGMGHANTTLINQLPVLSNNNKLFQSYTHLRSLSLICLTSHYSDLWAEYWQESKPTLKDSWTKTDPRLSNDHFKNLTPQWNRNVALRTDYERRQALIEIDVLASMALNLTLEELKTIYRIQFPVLRQNESDTWYDQKGRIVFTCSKGLTGVGYDRKSWNEIKDMKEGTVERVVMDDTLPGGPRERTIVYHAPFDRCDREKDYDVAWSAFEKRLETPENGEYLS